MTNITKAAQDALAALDEIHAGKRHPQLALAVAQQLRAALQGKAVEVPADGWLQDGGLLYRLTDVSRPKNRDEINVTMADGSRSLESRARRAGELLDRIRSAKPAPVVPDDVVRYRTIRDGLVYIEPHESGEIYVAGETGVYTKSGDEFDAAIDAIASYQQKGGSAG